MSVHHDQRMRYSVLNRELARLVAEHEDLALTRYDVEESGDEDDLYDIDRRIEACEVMEQATEKAIELLWGLDSESTGEES